MDNKKSETFWRFHLIKREIFPEVDNICSAGPVLGTLLSVLVLFWLRYCQYWSCSGYVTVSAGPVLGTLLSVLVLFWVRYCQYWSCPGYVTVSAGPVLGTLLSVLVLSWLRYCQYWSCSGYVTVSAGPVLATSLSVLVLFWVRHCQCWSCSGYVTVSAGPVLESPQHILSSGNLIPDSAWVKRQVGQLGKTAHAPTISGSFQKHYRKIRMTSQFLLSNEVECQTF